MSSDQTKRDRRRADCVGLHTCARFSCPHYGAHVLLAKTPHSVKSVSMCWLSRTTARSHECVDLMRNSCSGRPLRIRQCGVLSGQAAPYHIDCLGPYTDFEPTTRRKSRLLSCLRGARPPPARLLAHALSAASGRQCVLFAPRCGSVRSGTA